MGNQIPPKHSLEDVIVEHTGPPVCHAWGPAFHGMQIIIHTNAIARLCGGMMHYSFCCLDSIK